MKLAKKKILAFSLAMTMLASTVYVQKDVVNVQAETAGTENRVGDDGCLEIPGTISSFDEYNSSFLSVTGFAEGGVNDRSADIGTSKHRQVTTEAEFLQAIKDAKRGSYTDESGKVVTPVSQGSVTIIEIMNDLELGNMISGYSDIQSNMELNPAYIVTHTSDFPGVTEINLDDINGLTIFSSNGAKVEHCLFQIGKGGTGGTGSNDIVIRNLKFDGCWQWDNTGKSIEGGWAYMKIYKSSNIWIDHCSFTIAGDGNVDVESGSNGITISWCKFGMTIEEALAEDSVVRDSVEFMESKYQKAEKAAAKFGGVAGVISTYEDVCQQVRNAGYDPEDASSITELQNANSTLYTSFISAQKAYTRFYSESANILVNNGMTYANMRLDGATPEQIMEYAAYHSKALLNGSGDREFKDYDTEEMLTINADGTYTLDENGDYIEDSNERLELTLAYDCYNNVGSRIPLMRTGVGHLYNCYFDNSEHEATLKYDGIRQHGTERLSRGINARNGASVAADTCVYNCFNQPIIGQELQGNDITNMHPITDSLYATAINWGVIVNSKMSNSSGKTYEGSSWDNGGMNLFTGNGYGIKYTDLTLKKFCWDSKITHIGTTNPVPISQVSRNVLSLATFADTDKACEHPFFVWHKGRTSDPTEPKKTYCGCGFDEFELDTPSWLVRLKDEDGNYMYNSKGHAMWEPFVWEYNFETGLPYEYQMVELDKVEEVVPANSGAGSITMANSEDWLRTYYSKEETVVAEKTDPTPTTEPSVSTEPTTAPTESEAPTTAPTESEEPTVAPTESEEPTVAPIESEEPTVAPTESEEPTVAPTESEEPTTAPTEYQEPTVAPPISEEPVSPPVIEPDYMLGDMDFNKKVELADAQMALKAALKIIELTTKETLVADVDVSGKVELTDAQKILKVALKIDTFDEPEVGTAGILGFIKKIVIDSVINVW